VRQPRRDRRADRLRDGIGRLLRVDHDAAPRLGLGAVAQAVRAAVAARLPHLAPGVSDAA
jgi:dTMP kinase